MKKTNRSRRTDRSTWFDQSGCRNGPPERSSSADLPLCNKGVWALKFTLMLHFEFVAQAVPHQCIAHHGAEHRAAAAAEKTTAGASPSRLSNTFPALNATVPNFKKRRFCTAQAYRTCTVVLVFTQVWGYAKVQLVGPTVFYERLWPFLVAKAASSTAKSRLPSITKGPAATSS